MIFGFTDSNTVALFRLRHFAVIIGIRITIIIATTRIENVIKIGGFGGGC